MSKHGRQEASAAEQSVAQPENLIEVPVPTGNFILTLKRGDHPGNRSSYTVPGNSGNVVFFNTLFANGVPPATITLDCELVSPQASVKVDKSEAAALKAIEKAAKAQAKIEAAALKAAEKQAKAEAVLKAARERVEQAQAKAAVAV